MELDFFINYLKREIRVHLRASEWGRINFLYKKKKEIRQIISVKKNKKKQKIFEVTNEKFKFV